MSVSVDHTDLSTFEQRKRTVLKDITAEANDKSPKGSLDAPIVDLIQIINQCPDIYTTSSCSGRVTLFLENHERKGGSWLYLSHAVTDYQTVHEVLLGFCEKFRAQGNDSDSALTFRFEPFILSLECSSFDVAARLLQVAISSGFRESGMAGVNKRFMLSIRCSIRLEVPLWDAAIVSSSTAGGVSRSSLWPLMISPEYVRYLVDLSTQKFEANFARIAVFSTNFIAAFGALQQPSQAAPLTGTEMSSFVSLSSDLLSRQTAVQRRLVEVDARLMRAALALKINPSTILRPADNLLRSSIQLNSTVEKNEVWCLAAPVPHGGFVQDLLREAHWKSREHRVIHLPHRAEIVTHIAIPLNALGLNQLRVSSSIRESLLVFQTLGKHSTPNTANTDSFKSSKVVHTLPNDVSLQLVLLPCDYFINIKQQSIGVVPITLDPAHYSTTAIEPSTTSTSTTCHTIVAKPPHLPSDAAIALLQSLPSDSTPHRRMVLALQRLVLTHCPENPGSEHTGLWSRLLAYVPKKWEVLGGDLVLLPLSAFSSPDWNALMISTVFAYSVWQAVASALRVSRVGRQAEIHPDGKRRSQVTMVFPDTKCSGWVAHRVLGVTMHFDVTLCMYASGNGSEKQRLLTLVESQSKLELEQDSVSVTSNTTSHSALEGHVVLDLYTGIGYFSVPLLARLDRSLLSRMLLCEWNLDALEALRRSLQANGVAPDRYEIYPGDNRQLRVSSVADRVLLGLIPSSQDGWRPAIEALRDRGGQMHVHANVKEHTEKEWAKQLLVDLVLIASTMSAAKQSFLVCLRNHGFHKKFAVTHIEVVKNYAPHVVHIVVDVVAAPPYSSLPALIAKAAAVAPASGDISLEVDSVVSQSCLATEIPSHIHTSTSYLHRQEVRCWTGASERAAEFWDSGNGYAAREPLLLRGISLGTAPQIWSPEYLIRTAPDDLVNVLVCGEDRMSFTERNYVMRTMSLPELIARAAGNPALYNKRQSGGESLTHYLAPNERYYMRTMGENVRSDIADFPTQYSETLAKDLHLPAEWLPSHAMFSSAFRCSSSGIHLWTHYDISDNFLCHAVGRKRVVLFPPSDLPYLYVKTSSSDIVDIDNPDLERFPKFVYTHPLEVILEPGDVLFIPALWFHNVLSLEFSISVNFFWHHLIPDEHWYDAHDVYGNKDLLPAQQLQNSCHDIRRTLAAMPQYYADFYRLRAVEILLNGARGSVHTTHGHDHNGHTSSHT